MKKVKKEDKDSKNKAEDKEVEVLYQRMGDRWFAFTLIDNEVFMGSVVLNDGESPVVGRLKPMYEKL